MTRPVPWGSLPPHEKMAYQSQKQYENRMRAQYPQYHKDVRHLDYIDVYLVHSLFEIDDPSGCLQHADKKILLSGVRTGGKPKRKDIEEARDTLTRWLEIHDAVAEASHEANT